MSKTKIKKIAYSAVSVAMLLAPAAALAQVDIESMTGSGAGISDATVPEIITSVAFWILAILGVLAVVMFIVGGIMYLTSGGNEDRVNSAKKLIIYAIVGVVVALVALVIVQAIRTMVVEPSGSF